ncbi:MAG: glycosyltransferase family 4 protein [Alphaproteobacteria bacterium]
MNDDAEDHGSVPLHETDDPPAADDSMPVQASTGGWTVLQVLPALVTGGVERGTIDVAIALRDAGWLPLVASSGGPMVRELERAGIEHIALPLQSKNPLVIRRNMDRLEQIILERGVHIVHARSRAPAWSAMIAAERTGARFVTTFHGTYNLGPFALKRSYNAVMARGERVIAISRFISDHIQEVYDVDPNHIRIIPRGIDIGRFDPSTVSPRRMIALARTWRLPDGVPVVMLPGRLTRWKGQTVLIEALARLPHREFRCLLVGADQGRARYRRHLESLIIRNGLEGVVQIVDHCNDMGAAYMLTDVVVSASTDPDAFGRVSVEAQAMGRPVIASDHGGSRETVLPGVTGWLVPPRDPEALAIAIQTVLSLTAEERRILAEIQRAHVVATFTRENMCANTLDVYREILTDTPFSEPPAPEEVAGP